MKNRGRFRKYVPSILLLLLFEAVAAVLWLVRDNLFYLLNFSYIGCCLALGAALFAAGGPIRARSPLGTVAVRPFGTLGATGGPFGAFRALRPFGTFLRLVPRVVEISGVAGISGRIAFDGHGGVLVRGLSSRRDMKVP